MSDDKCCENCKYFAMDSFGRDDEGYCRRYPPDNTGHWPLVELEDWCGEYNKDEDKTK